MKMSKKKFQDFVIKTCSKVKFKTRQFGWLEKGSIINVYKISDTGDRALLYSPYDRHGTGCFIIARKPFAAKYYVDFSNNDDDNYVNFEGE